MNIPSLIALLLVASVAVADEKLSTNPGAVAEYKKALASSDPVSSFQHLNSALRLDPMFAEAYLQRGKCVEMVGKYDGLALGFLIRNTDETSDYRKAVELKPSLVPARSALGHALIRDGKIVQAKKVFETAAKDFPNHAHVQAELARFQIVHDKKPKLAIKQLNRAIELDGKRPDYYHLRMQARRDTHQYGQALADYERFRRMHKAKPKDKFGLELTLGELAVRAGQYKKALKALEIAVRSRRHRMRARRWRGEALLRTKRLKEAGEDLRFVAKNGSPSRLYTKEAKELLGELEGK